MCVCVCVCSFVSLCACVSAVSLCARDVAIRIKEKLLYREDASRDLGSHAPGGSSLPMICKVIYIDIMKFMYKQSCGCYSYLSLKSPPLLSIVCSEQHVLLVTLLDLTQDRSLLVHSCA